MSENNQEGYKLREKRFLDAFAMKEPDRVPILEPGTNTFAYSYAGYTMAEVLYDLEKAKDAIRRYHKDFDIDSGHSFGAVQEGQGPLNELAQNKSYFWAGMPEGIIGENSVQQFNEFPLLEDDEFDMMNTDMTGAMLTKILPRQNGLMAPFAHFSIDSLSYPVLAIDGLAMAFAQPEFKAMVEGLTKYGEMKLDYFRQAGEFGAEIEAMGYPIMTPSIAIVAFDVYSDFIRGTIGAGLDLYDHPETVKAYMDRQVKTAIGAIQAMAVPNRMLFIPMHKGMDRFMSDEHYAEFYFPYLLQIVNAAIEVNMVPYVYTEGHYTTRLKFLKQLPVGKCVVHFEDVDMALAKKEMEGIACIAGNFPARILANSSKKQVVEEVKKLLDICAPGGGYIFDLDGGIYNYNPENVAAMFDAVKEFGKY
ncbi:MAG: hypothetical protein FWD72_02400 [Eggerthellaceae bacterium]|nr:hypothetical protein [Eggerthellaceae bacterium]